MGSSILHTGPVAYFGAQDVGVGFGDWALPAGLATGWSTVDSEATLDCKREADLYTDGSVEVVQWAML